MNRPSGHGMKYRASGADGGPRPRRMRQLQAPIGWAGYLLSADFWSRTLQNWQSARCAGRSVSVDGCGAPARSGGRTTQHDTRRRAA
ncbi:DUF6766 family protein [Streptomyces sp. V1I1]|uniref:DUF6766 family protein n=1 Tax=Streptomyces sp. V1I1 TaxID=3042272 RepID=UPI0027D7E7AC|nr:DUF6766 family protein [Streptomyces sp. V1I1]